MEDHLIAIEKDIQNGNYYAALFLALAVPSICGALESNDGQDTSQKYKDWYYKYVLDTTSLSLIEPRHSSRRFESGRGFEKDRTKKK